VLVLRNETERPEAVESGAVRLAGTRCDDIVRQANLILDNIDERRMLSQAINPYGDGKAAGRIAAKVCEFLQVPFTE
jgi:UDP-N-acetylglucosamine 2-epimerase (non-hydrolysing)